MRYIARIISTWFGIGYFPLAPGTLTSFVVVLLYKCCLNTLSLPLYSALFLLVFLTGIAVSGRHSQDIGRKDPRVIVIDEAAGQLLALFMLHPTWFLCLSSFFLFRLFDIIKPFPIKKVEAFPKGWGIMLDDIIAAVYAGILINVYLLLQ
jgi:phosphatidylglycerophosphatase A